MVNYDSKKIQYTCTMIYILYDKTANRQILLGSQFTNRGELTMIPI